MTLALEAPLAPTQARSKLIDAAAPVLAVVTLVILNAPWIGRDILFGVLPLDREVLRLVGFPLCGLAIGLIVLDPTRAFRLAMEHLLLILLTAWAALSVLWSVDPATSINRAIALIIVLISAFGLATRLDARTMAPVVGIAVAVGLAISLGLLLAGDPLAIDHRAEGVRGGFSHKNVFGQMGVFGALLGLGMMQARNLPQVGLIICALGVASVAVAGSATAIVATISGAALLGVLMLVGSPRLPAWVKPAVLLLTTLCALLLAMSWTLILDLLGREANLTGRDQIWSFVLAQVAERPLLGYGLRAFWTADYNQGLVHSYFYLGYDQAHNGYLQILLDLGYIGLAIFIAWLVTVAVRAVRGLGDPDNRTWIALWGAFILYSMAEAIYLMPNGFGWMVIMVAALTGSRREPQGGLGDPRSAAKLRSIKTPVAARG